MFVNIFNIFLDYVCDMVYNLLMRKLSLNKKQQIAEQHITGPMMVLAGPGSGKTAVITARAAFLVASGVPAHNILVITYSKAAASEMENRFRNMYDDTVPQVTFGTFHSVFFRMLRRKHSYNLDQIFGEGERRTLIRGFLTEMEYDQDDEFLSSVMGEMSLVRNELHDIMHYHSTTIGEEHFRELLTRYERYKHEKNKIDFDDMLCHSYKMFQTELEELDHWRKMFTYIMIDEFQDINSVQFEMVKLLAAPLNNLFIVGDDDQSIYRFRGARPEFLLNFPNDYPSAKQVTLDTNYRSTDTIIQHANNLITTNVRRYDKQIHGLGQKGVKPVVLVATDQNHEAIQIAEKIRHLLKKGANPDEIAVAFRLNMQARAFMDAFLNMNIPFKTRDEIPTLYDHWIAEDLFAFLRVARRLSLRQKFGYDSDATRIINKPFRFISKAFLAGLKKDDADLFRVYGNSGSLHTATKSNIEELHRDLLSVAKRDTADAIRYIRKKLNYNGHIMDTCEYRKLRPAGLYEIADELTEAAKQFSNPLDFIAHAKEAAEAVKQTEQTGPCCTLTTMHSAKGLEFERVFIAGVVEELVPSVRSKTAAEIEEERRLFYVGITRAKLELYISTIKSRYDKPSEPSRFLDEMFCQ